DRAERHGRTKEQARELWRQAAKSAAICAGCFRPLAATDSVTMEWRNVGTRRNPHGVRVPICLLCTLDEICSPWWRTKAGDYETPRWHRTRCLNCSRSIRIYGYSLNARTCCEDCRRAVRLERNKIRRRVGPRERQCARCGELFISKRTDALTCSNKCRQALHREERLRAGDVEHPLVTHEREHWLYWHPGATAEDFARLLRSPKKLRAWRGQVARARVAAAGEAWERDHPGREWPEHLCGLSDRDSAAYIKYERRLTEAHAAGGGVEHPRRRRRQVSVTGARR